MYNVEVNIKLNIIKINDNNSILPKYYILSLLHVVPSDISDGRNMHQESPTMATPQSPVSSMTRTSPQIPRRLMSYNHVQNSNLSRAQSVIQLSTAEINNSQSSSILSGTQYSALPPTTAQSECISICYFTLHFTQHSA